MKTHLLCPIALLGLAAAGNLAAEPAAVHLGAYAGPRVTLLAIDDQALPLRDHLCYYLSHPKVRREPVLTPNHTNPHATDTVGDMFYGAVLHEHGKFRMWYYGVGFKQTMGEKATDDDWDKNLKEGPACYAESDDGIHWTKPNLGQVEWHGGSDNNALKLPDESSEGVFVIRDDADPDPSRRYKMVYEASLPHVPSHTAVSPDGIHWTGAGAAETDLEPSSFYKFGGLYTINAQNTDHIGEDGHRAGRQGFAYFSPDFVHWLPQSGEAFLLPEPLNPNQRGGDRPYVQVHLGVGGAPFGNVVVGLYCQWHALPNPGDWFGQATTFGDLGLVVSDDGQHFREVVKGHVFLSRHDSAPRFDPQIRTEEILTQSGNGILNVGNETWIYHGRWMNTEFNKDYYGEIALATLPRDRWGALGLYPKAQGGSVWTAPLWFDGDAELTLNAEGAEGITVEAADARFQPMPDYSGANAGTCTSRGGLDCPVTWPHGGLAALRGRPIRFLIRLQKSGANDPRLYGAYVAGR